MSYTEEEVENDFIQKENDCLGAQFFYSPTVTSHKLNNRKCDCEKGQIRANRKFFSKN